jgi:hypothetical protein
MEFKFRVWDKITEKMYYPFTGVADDLYLSLEGRVCSEEEDEQQDGTRMAYRGYRMTPLFWTGLTDKNGKNIYNGDLISSVKYETDIPVGQLWEVYYDEERLTYYRRNNDGVKDPLWELGLLQLPKYIVVGNVYEMPEWNKN